MVELQKGMRDFDAAGVAVYALSYDQPMLEATVDEAVPEEVQVRVALDGDSLARSVQKDLVVRFSVPAGRHVYAEPTPQGSVAVEVTLELTLPVSEPPVVALRSRKGATLESNAMAHFQKMSERRRGSG